MSRNSSTNGRLKGIFLRGKKFWYRYSYERRQYRVPLDTEDEGEAITKALKICANPLLAGAEPLSDEIKSYLEAKQDDGTYTRNSADSRGPALNRWVRERHLVTVQVGGWGRPLVCRLAGPLARCSDRTRFTEPEAP
jgi:hypothetical protein